ncbi:N-acetyltransferase [Actinocatenispora thailandica]|uniref:N-acetyltransferase n=1 Tax=Actinocatenispora thailandica TaxID=227318 RepID=A0A7R7DJR2_9ACTN|nr:N-acetyltransferase [Actinocatenispora thailandica]
MLTDVWPLFGLVLRTGRIELRLPRDDELAALAELAGRGVHRPDQRPFLTPWTDGSPTDRARRVLRGHWSDLAEWQPASWCLGLGVFRDGEPVGSVTLRGTDFRVVREVTTSSWLGLAHQRQGYGTEARTGLLALAFDHLGARAARTEVFPDNAASCGVSRKLGYQPDGISVDARGDEALVSHRLRLTRAGWLGGEHPPVAVDGLAPCLPLFGL